MDKTNVPYNIFVGGYRLVDLSEKAGGMDFTHYEKLVVNGGDCCGPAYDAHEEGIDFFKWKPEPIYRKS